MAGCATSAIRSRSSSPKPRQRRATRQNTIVVDYTPLPCVVDAVAALAPGAPSLWDTGNELFRFQRGDQAAVQAAFASAAHVVEIEVVNNRLVIAPIETRAAIGTWTNGMFDLFVTAASVHAIRDQLADSVFRCPARSRSAFRRPTSAAASASRTASIPNGSCCCGAARRLGRPVKWVEDRAEDFVSTAQGRDNVSHARLALDADGKFLALDVSTIAGLGAYMSGGGPGSSTNAPAAAMGGGYVIPAIFMDVRAAFTNTAPIDAYRGAGKPEANYLIERLIDKAAGQCGFDPIDLRRRNLIASLPLPKGARHHGRLRPFRRQHRRRAGPGRPCRFPPASRRQRKPGQASRHRRRLLPGNRPRRPERGRGNPFR